MVAVAGMGAAQTGQDITGTEAAINPTPLRLPFSSALKSPSSIFMPRKLLFGTESLAIRTFHYEFGLAVFRSRRIVELLERSIGRSWWK